MRGGGASEHDYAADGTLLFWMDGGRFNGTDSTSGSTPTENWGNRMGSGYPYFRQPTAGNRPSLVQVNGIWVVDFGPAASTTSINGFDHMDFVNSSGSNSSVDAVDTHTMALFYIGETVGDRFLIGTDGNTNLQIGTNNSVARAIGSPSIWSNDLNSDVTLTADSWYLFEAIMRGGGERSSLLLNGTERASSTFDQTTAVNIEIVGGSSVNSSSKRNLGGKIARFITYDITSGLVSGAAEARADMLALKEALEA
jgi:hypothetical protein